MEPADLLGFVGLAVGGFAAEDSAQVRRRDPVLAFRGEAMIGDAEQALDSDLDANLFERLANRALLEGLGEVQLTPDNARTTGFRRALAKRQQNTAALVDQQDANADLGTAISIDGSPTGVSLTVVRLDGVSSGGVDIAHGSPRGLERGLAKHREHVLGERKSAKQERRVEGIAGEGVPEEGEAGHIAGDQACGCAGKTTE